MKHTYWNICKDIPNYVLIFCNRALNNESKKNIQNSGLPAPFISICKELHVNRMIFAFQFMNKCHGSHNYDLTECLYKTVAFIFFIIFFSWNVLHYFFFGLQKIDSFD